MVTRRLATLAMLACVALTGCGAGSESSSLSGPTTLPLASDAGRAGGLRLLGAMVSAPDHATIPGYRNNFDISRRGDTLVVTSRTNPVDVREFEGVRLLKFVDMHVSYDVDGAPGQLFRLYRAAFSRTPDDTGLGFWIDAHANGLLTIEQVGREFSRSAEFARLYGGDIGNEQFIKLVYNNVLHRDPDQSGYEFWLKAMVAHGLSREALLYSFSESDENRRATAAATANGVEFRPVRSDTIIPQASSLANKSAALASMGPQPNTHGASAFADFFGEGKYSMVVNSNVYDRDDPRTQDRFGSIAFFQNIGGRWVDNTSKLLKDTTGCLHPRKAIVVDFNQDGKPDVMMSCHGFDAAPFPGEMQRILLSQADGSYSNVNTGINCFCHGASAADVNGDNYPDILLADQIIEKNPYFLINNRDGTFRKDLSRLPSLYMKQIWTAELLASPAGGYDVFLAGADPQGDSTYQLTPTIFHNDGTGHFNGARIALPLLDTPVSRLGNGAVLDVAYKEGKIYLLRTFGYEAMSVEKHDLALGSRSEIYAHTGMYPRAGAAWFSWIGFYNGKLVSTIADYEVAISD